MVYMELLKSTLTKEERDILIMVAVHPCSKHLSNSEIGRLLGIPISRVKTLIHQACIKLGADNRNEAVFLAMRRGEISLRVLVPLFELAEILSSVDSNVLLAIANRVRHDQVQKILPKKSKQIIHLDKRQPGILTNRERDVLILSGRGLTNMEIADSLCISDDAVRTFLNRAFKKLGTCKKSDAVVLALKHKEISVEEISSTDELAFYLAPLGAEAIEKLAQLLDDKVEKESLPFAS
jgi:DNA-binding CsgD family transcriptional regulator